MAVFTWMKRLLTLLKNVVYLFFKEAWARISKAEAKSIREDIILVTGGGKGIGKQIALQFAIHKPAHIILWGRTETCLEETANAVRRLDVNCAFMLCDVADREQIYSCAQELKAKFGEVSILVNNAGVVIGNTILDAKPEDIERTFDVNTLAHMWTLKAFLPDMLKNNRGHIVIISSVLGLFGLKGAGDYVSSKFASTGLSESLRQEMRALGKNVKVTSVHPYQVDNDMFPGMQTRLSFLLPPLSERDVAERTVDAVLHDSCQILMPRFMYLLYFFNSLMPVTVSTIVNKALGVDKAMDTVIKNSAARARSASINSITSLGAASETTAS
ncbi:short-chain dehydrogenase/reductase 3-like [Littorina saxatilis]|uniref:Short-chain dehydrogenase/reductase 3 n=1 Tax=Littorina saxatilis TaxID=31220 RepID=A0AAN9AW54_9CAEN